MEDAMRTQLSFALLAVAFACSHTISAADAAPRDRVFVASYGNDANPCSFTSPCRNFQQAINTVAVGGEVTAIDSAGFGPISISHSVTITSPNGIEAGIVPNPPTADAITIAAGSSDIVVLRGLTLDGNATSTHGINVTSAGHLEIYNCAIRNFVGGGIVVQSTVPISVLISNSVVADVPASGAIGIYLFAGTSGAFVTATLKDVTVYNSDTGIALATNLAGGVPMTVAMDEVTVTNSKTVGVAANAAGGNLEVLISNSHLDNDPTGVKLSGANSNSVATAILTNVTLNQLVVGNTGIEIGANSFVYVSQVTQTNAAGFATALAALIDGGGNNGGFSDGTNRFMGGIAGGNFQTWLLNK
jgi:hypothetical protein